MAKKTKVVHVNLDEADHTDLRLEAEALDMPLATYCKAVLLRRLINTEVQEECPITEATPSVRRKSRTITNRR